ncbi:amidohydrolase family protein [Streptomyces sp. SID13726]|uniref:amidohydrolase family protein n=1 Tax=Streptomyces sp. SID13726 TaxID=2706058 RepID=UPI0013BC47DF|nr:amidohydrolase family protein [Streptomyces sp. SID13726]NEB03516.1 amidohydrolase [Streptomyces sp. SID13726]
MTDPRLDAAHGVRRRGILKAAVPLGAAAALGPSVAHAEAAEATALPTGNYRIDVHCHLVPDFYRTSLAAHGVVESGGVPFPAWSPTLAVNFMNRYGIQTQVVSVSEPGVMYLSSAADRVAMARRLNDYMSKSLVHTDTAGLKGRFGAFAVLPLGGPVTEEDVAAAVVEARRAVRELKLDGVGIFSSYKGTYLGDPVFEPLMKVLDELGVMVFIHPTTPQNYPDLGLPPFLYEFTFDTTRALVNMLYKGVYTRRPNIRWLGAHAGGTLPYLSFRTSLLTLTPAIAQTLGIAGADDSSPHFRKLFYDTALSHAPQAMKSVRELAGDEHILFATDWPFSGALFPTKGDPAPQLDETFSPAARVKVERSNALAQFPELAGRVKG